MCRLKIFVLGAMLVAVPADAWAASDRAAYGTSAIGTAAHGSIARLAQPLPAPTPAAPGTTALLGLLLLAIGIVRRRPRSVPGREEALLPDHRLFATIPIS